MYIFPILCLVFALLPISFSEQKVLILINFLIYFPFGAHAFGVTYKNSSLKPKVLYIFQYSFPPVLMAFYFTFKTMNHFELIFVYVLYMCLDPFFKHTYPVVRAPFVQKVVFFPLNCLCAFDSLCICIFSVCVLFHCLLLSPFTNTMLTIVAL